MQRRKQVKHKLIRVVLFVIEAFIGVSAIKGGFRCPQFVGWRKTEQCACELFERRPSLFENLL
jgi:hypothetical protein